MVAWVSEKDRKLEQHPDQDVNVPYVRSSDASRARDELGLVANKFSPGSDIRFLRLPLIAPGTIDTSDPPQHNQSFRVASITDSSNRI